LYPVKVATGWNRYDGKAIKECQSDVEVEAALQEILSSDTVRRVIESLMAQSAS